MTEWKNPIFSEDFIFSDLRTGCNRIYSGPGSSRPPPTSPLLPRGRNGKSPTYFMIRFNIWPNNNMKPSISLIFTNRGEPITDALGLTGKGEIFWTLDFHQIPEGVSPWALLRNEPGGGNVRTFQIFSLFIFFADLVPARSHLVQEKRGKTNSRGRQPFFAQIGRRKCPNFSDTFIFFRIWLGPRKRRKKKISDFQTFRLSVDFCGKQNSKTINIFDIRPGEEKFCSDSKPCSSDIGVDPLRCPPCPLAPKNVFFSPNFKLLIAQKFLNFLE